MNLSFAGCGFLGIYHVGVASCFREYAPHVLFSKIAGASVGSIAAAALICDVSLGQTTTDILSVAVKARSRTLGPLSPMFDLNQLIAENLDKGLPPNAHQFCNGRLFISVTRWDDCKNILLSQFNTREELIQVGEDCKNVLLSQFDTREELIQALLCSCFIPGYSGLNIPSFRGVRYVDGGLSNNLPVLDENTVTVSPFAGEHDICPRDESCNILQVNLANTSIAISPGNMYRLCRILFPPKPEILSKICQQGFDDALKFLQRKNVIACTRCLGVQSSLSLAETGSETSSEKTSSSLSGGEHSSENCIDCKNKRQKAHSSSLPEAVVQAIEEVCEQVNKGILNWFLRFAPIRWLSYLGKPYIVPIAIPVDITLVIISKVYEKLPSFRKEIQSKIFSVINLVKQVLSKLNRNRHLYSAKFSCQLAITEFDYTEDNVVSSYAFPLESVQPHEACSVKIVEEKVPKRKLSFRNPESSICLLSPTPEPRLQRKSYAGFTPNYPKIHSERVRRKSLTEVNKPERVIRNMKFGFIVDLMPTVSTKDTKKNVVEALQSLGEEENELNVIELTNKALNMEREYIDQHQDELAPEAVETLGQILNVSKNEALMSWYYIGEDKSVQITELYNVSEADTSIVLPDEEREVNNQLSWEKDWINMIESPDSSRRLSSGSRNGSKLSLCGSLDDSYESSESGCDVEKDTFDEDNYEVEKKEPFTPKRKNSFIIIN